MDVDDLLDFLGAASAAPAPAPAPAAVRAAAPRESVLHSRSSSAVPSKSAPVSNVPQGRVAGGPLLFWEPKASAEMFREELTGLRVSGRLISCADLSVHLSNRAFYSLAKLPGISRQALESTDPSCAWATGGVLTRSRRSKNKFSYVLSDLSPEGRSAAVHLGPEVASALGTRNMTGRLVFLLSPHPFPLRPDQPSDRLVLNVENSAQLLNVGKAMDFKFCSGVLKQTGFACEMAVDITKTQFCRYHRATGSHRSSVRQKDAGHQALTPAQVVVPLSRVSTSQPFRTVQMRKPADASTGINAMGQSRVPLAPGGCAARHVGSGTIPSRRESVPGLPVSSYHGGTTAAARPPKFLRSINQAREADKNVKQAKGEADDYRNSLLLKCDPQSHRRRTEMEQERAAKRARRETTGNKAESLSTIPEKVDVLGPLLTAPAARRKASLLQSYGSNSKKQNPGLNDRATFSDVAKNGSVVIPAESAIFSRPRNVPLPRPPSAVPSIVPNEANVLQQQKLLAQRRKRSQASNRPAKVTASTLLCPTLTQERIDAIQREAAKLSTIASAAARENLDSSFNSLERREYATQQMESITEKKVSLWFCEADKRYVSGEAINLCKKSGHQLVKRSAVMRFFQCKKCSRRQHAYDTRVPDFNCEFCGAGCATWKACGSSSSSGIDPGAPRMMTGISEWTRQSDLRSSVMNV